MVNCCVPWCNNYYENTASRGVSYHQIPKDPRLNKLWKDLLRRVNLPADESTHVCSSHFTSADYDSDYQIREKLTGQKLKRRLKRDAVPSKFDFPTSSTSTSKKPRVASERRAQERARRETITQIFGATPTCEVDATTTADTGPALVTEIHGQDSQGETQEQAAAADPSSGLAECGVQCSLEVKHTITATVGTQTDLCPEINPTFFKAVTYNASVQVDEKFSTDKWNISHDHPYSLKTISDPFVDLQPSSQTTTLSRYTDSNHSKEISIEVVQPATSNAGNDEKDELPALIDCDDDDDDDDEYTPKHHESSSSDTETETETESPVAETKFIVFESCLAEHLKHCPYCGAVVTESSSSTSGSLLKVKLSCHNGHATQWNSQPLVNKTPAGNLLLASAILFTGNTFTPVNNFVECFGLEFIKESTFYEIQNEYLFPVINAAWEKERQNTLRQVKMKGAVNLNGDGRCDSPGHNAKYGTYTLMDDNTDKITTFSIVQVSEVTSSNAMEKEGFIRCLTTLEDNEVVINRITTDRHTGISSCMDKDHQDKKHQYDVWHVSKWVIKKLTNKSKVKGCEDLKPWIQSISNHLWWCAATCNGDVELLREKWKSVVHHVVNKHSWKDSKLFHKCSHQKLSRAQLRNTAWLKAGSPAHVALEEVVLNRKLLKDLAKLADFCHTGGLEVYHSMLLKYCPKREHFTYQGMLARTQLAALDNNSNVGRQQAVERSGQPRYRPCYPKGTKRWVVKPISKCKDYSFRTTLMEDVVRSCKESPPSKPVIPNLPKNIASEPAPPKQELIQNHKSRFNN